MTPLFWLATGVVAGVFGAAGWLVTATGGCWLLRRKKWLAVLLLVAATAGSSAYRIQMENRLQNASVPGFISGTAVVIAPLDRRESYAFLHLRMTADGRQLRAKISRYSQLLPGDKVEVSGTVKVADGRAPGESFDYAAYLRRYRLTGLLTYPKIGPVQGINSRFWLLRWLTVGRGQLEASINRLLPEPEASFLAGLLLGTRRAIPPAVLDNLTRTGTTHIIAVSGSNVVIVAGTLLTITRLLTGRRHFAFALSLTGIMLFVILTGLQAAAVRGGVVAALALIAKQASRQPHFGSVIIVPAAAMVAVNPLIVTDIGWQLSFAAFSGIFFLSDWVAARLVRLPLPPLLLQPLVETTAASLPVTPLAMYHFGTFSLSAFLINPAVLWLIPLAMGLGFAATIFSIIIPPTLIVGRLLAIGPLHLILTVVHYGALIPGSFIQT